MKHYNIPVLDRLDLSDARKMEGFDIGDPLLDEPNTYFRMEFTDTDNRSKEALIFSNVAYNRTGIDIFDLGRFICRLSNNNEPKLIIAENNAPTTLYLSAITLFNQEPVMMSTQFRYFGNRKYHIRQSDQVKAFIKDDARIVDIKRAIYKSAVVDASSQKETSSKSEDCQPLVDKDVSDIPDILQDKNAARGQLYFCVDQEQFKIYTWPELLHTDTPNDVSNEFSVNHAGRKVSELGLLSGILNKSFDLIRKNPNGVKNPEYLNNELVPFLNQLVKPETATCIAPVPVHIIHSFLNDFMTRGILAESQFVMHNRDEITSYLENTFLK